MTTETAEIEQGVIEGLATLTKDELGAAADQFGVEVKRSMSKADLVQRLAEDGVTLSLITGFKTVDDDDAEEDAEEEIAPEAPVVDEDDDDENLVLVRMIRANNTYQIRGYTFKLSHPFALVKEEDADYLIEHDGGFRMASPKEAREFYN